MKHLEGIGCLESDLDWPEDCYNTAFYIGYDIDNTSHQYKHICYTYPTGALCGTRNLWFHGNKLDEIYFLDIDCKVCLHLWEKRKLSL